MISEYLDEVYPPSLHPESALEKARHRAWVEFGSEQLGAQFRMLVAQDEAGFIENRDELRSGLKRLESAMSGDGPFFSGQNIALIDTALAPIFMRLAIVNAIRPLELFSDDSPMGRWSSALLAQDSVKESVVPEFEELFLNFFRSKNSYALS